MSEADRIFDRFPDFIKEYIYSHGWQELREVQLAAARVIFDTESNLLLSSSTASGKTEAVFFPILSQLYDAPPEKESVQVLYVAPLKSLINDQFARMEELLSLSGVPVYHWHGDVGASHKTRLLRHPEGILQITPESLESMLMNRSNDILRLFGGLRYVILDEIHTLIGTDRGNQVLCQLCRIARLIGYHPRRIGLSATIGDPALACLWLGAGSGRQTVAPTFPQQKLRWRLGFEHFYIQNPNRLQTPSPTPATLEKAAAGGTVAASDAGFEYLYDAVRDKKALVFSNSREETELVTATLRQIARSRGERDKFLIHHGNLSASLREDAELKMKDDTEDVVTCATVTMELGIDIGKLERVVQVDAPNTVSGFLQRLGRSGRRGGVPEMVTVFREEMPLPNAPLPELVPWGLLRAIAIVQLYAEERFIEPPRIKKLPFSLAFHQTLSVLACCGELTPKELAGRVLSLPPFAGIEKEQYRELLVSMINAEFLERTEQKGLIIGLKGERLISSFKFYAVFRDSEDYTVRCEAEEIGTISEAVPQGERFALAGRVWEVTEIDTERRLIYVRAVEGKMEISWPGDSGEIHTRILQRMRRVLAEEQMYPYLGENAADRLKKARQLYHATGMDKQRLLYLSDTSCVLFPWLGTRAFRTLRRFLTFHAAELGVSGVESEGCCYITFKVKPSMRTHLGEHLLSLLRQGVRTEDLVSPSELPIYDKYDQYIPAELLRLAYATDRLDGEGVRKNFTEAEE